METVRLSYSEAIKLDSMPPVSAAIGFFDGIHLGHQEVIGSSISYAREHDLKSAVITFHPHPSVVLGKSDTREDYLTPLAEKEVILTDLGVDILYLIEFNKQLASLSPSDFVSYFIEGLNVKHLVSGFDFTYGFKGSGTPETLQQEAGSRFSYQVVEKIERQEEKVSSTRIRKLVAEGEVAEAETLLGRPLSLTGEVITGDQRGRTIGFPTANIYLNEYYFLPRVGVYAVEVLLDGERFYGMANLGFKPTFQKDAVKPNLEVFIFDFDRDIYGENLTVNWKGFIREEKKFNGIDELVTQLKSDEAAIRHYFHL